MGNKRKREANASEAGNATSPVSTPKKAEPQHAGVAEESMPQTDEQQHRRTLFVRSLAAETTTEDLTEHFSQSYPLKHAIAVLDPTTKTCKGYGFVTFADVEDAQRAKDEFTGSSIHGRKIRIDVAEPRNRDLDTAGGVKAAGAERKAAREKQLKEANAPPRIIVRNLPWSIKKSEQLAALFQPYGKVKNVIIPETKPGLMSGFGIVLMRGRKNAEKAIEGVNGKEIDGRTIAVDWAVDKDTWQSLQEAQKEADKEAKKKGEEAGKVTAEETEVKAEVLPKGEDDGDEEEEEDKEDGGVGVFTGEEGEDDDTDEEDDDDEEGEKAAEAAAAQQPEDYSATLFIRNLPFTSTDETLEEHFSQFGPVRYARIVMDHATDRPKGTGFVRFRSAEDADTCLKGSSVTTASQNMAIKKGPASNVARSILQDTDSDPTGRYTMEGRLLQISRAVDRSEAARLTEEGVARRDRDKRRVFLLSEGTIPSNSPLYQKLSATEIAMREASMKQRKSLIQSNPSLHLSLTRLSVRNIPRSVTSKDLKALAREAIVGFAKDVQDGKRKPLSQEELNRNAEEMKEAELQRKRSGKGIVKQAKVVFESREGAKVNEDSGAGRSRGYGFIEYHTHRSALMGLRFLNGHAVGLKAGKNDKESKADAQDRKKRLIVEFAIENAQVVRRRMDMEQKSREKNPKSEGGEDDSSKPKANGRPQQSDSRKRRRSETGEQLKNTPNKASKTNASGTPSQEQDSKLAKRQQIIQKKRMVRRNRKKEVKK